MTLSQKYTDLVFLRDGELAELCISQEDRFTEMWELSEAQLFNIVCDGAEILRAENFQGETEMAEPKAKWDDLVSSM